MISPYAFLLLLVALVAQPAAAADPIYKSVDSEGRVTYSSTPPPQGAKTEKVAVPPPPTEDSIRQAEERARKTQAQVSEMQNQRIEKEAKEAEEARLRAEQQSQPPTVIEKPVYGYPPVVRPSQRRPLDKPVLPPQAQPRPQPR